MLLLFQIQAAGLIKDTMQYLSCGFKFELCSLACTRKGCVTTRVCSCWSLRHCVQVLVYLNMRSIASPCVWWNHKTVPSVYTAGGNWMKCVIHIKIMLSLTVWLSIGPDTVIDRLVVCQQTTKHWASTSQAPVCMWTTLLLWWPSAGIWHKTERMRKSLQHV